MAWRQTPLVLIETGIDPLITITASAMAGLLLLLYEHVRTGMAWTMSCLAWKGCLRGWRRPNATAAVARYSKQKREYHKKNGKLFARMMLATMDSTEGYHSPTAHMSFKYFLVSARLSLGGCAVR